MTFYLVFLPIAALLLAAPFLGLWHLWWLGQKCKWRHTSGGTLVLVDEASYYMPIYNWERFYP